MKTFWGSGFVPENDRNLTKFKSEWEELIAEDLIDG